MPCQKRNVKKYNCPSSLHFKAPNVSFCAHFLNIQQFISYSLIPTNTSEPQMQQKSCLGIRYKCSLKRAFKLTHSTVNFIFCMCIYICGVRIYNATEEKYNSYACQLSASKSSTQHVTFCKNLIHTQDTTCFSPLSKDDYNTLPHVLPGTVLQWCSSGIPPHQPHKILQDW